MFIFLRLAFGNIIKNRHNTVTILIAVVISVFFIILTMGYMDGFKLKIIREALKYGGNIQIYNRQYYDTLDFAPVEYNIDWNEALNRRIMSAGQIQSVRPEISFGAVANSPSDSKETMVLAIDYKNPTDIYDVRKKTVIEGGFIRNDGQALIGVKMAKLLGLKAGDRMILLTTDKYGSVNAVEAVISGIFRNYNPAEEEGLVVCSLGLARKLLGLGNAVTSITLNIDNAFLAEKKAQQLAEILPRDMAVLPWQKTQPLLLYSIQSMDLAVYIIAGIIIFAASLGIINSFMMNVIARFPEFGILRAMGVSKLQVFLMIMTESLALGIIGTIAGLLPGCAIVYYFQAHPLNYEAMGSMMSVYKGMDAVIGTALTLENVSITALTGILISMLASVYPAFMAINKKTADVLRVLE